MIGLIAFQLLGIALSNAFADEDVTCRDHIAKVTCVIRTFPDDGYAAGPINCLGSEQKYITRLESIYDRYPRALKRMFCSLKSVYIMKDLGNTAYSGIRIGKDGKGYAGLLINQDLLDIPINHAKWATWKEQLTFGVSPNSIGIKKDLPTISITSAGRNDDLLVFVVTHEFAHLFDASNDLQKFSMDCTHQSSSSKLCKALPGGWASLSWLTPKDIKPDLDFKHRTKICFYNCGDTFLTQSVIPELYETMYSKGFISLYSTVSSAEDLADAFAYYVLTKLIGVSYLLDTKQGKTYNLSEVLSKGPLRQKVEFIKTFLESPQIKYP